METKRKKQVYDYYPFFLKRSAVMFVFLNKGQKAAA